MQTMAVLGVTQTRCRAKYQSRFSRRTLGSQDNHLIYPIQIPGSIDLGTIYRDSIMRVETF